MKVQLFTKDGFRFAGTDDFLLNLDLMSGRTVLHTSLLGTGLRTVSTSDDFFYCQFRALSKIIIPGHWIDLTKGDVLKNSTDMLLHQTVYPDHRTSVLNWLGVVDSVEWDDINNPPGINSSLKLDKSNDKIIKGITMNPPAIHSVSVGMNFKWEKSHPEMDNWDFWMNEGREIDGKIVCRIVTEIMGYDELSFVYQGGDPYAKKLWAIGGSDETKKEKEKGDVSLKLKKTVNAMIQNYCGYTINFGDKNEVEISQEQFDAILTNLTAKVSELETEASIGREHLSQIRGEAEKNYRLLNEGQVDEGLILLIQEANYPTLKALNSDYEKRLLEKFPIKESRQSSVVDLKESKDSKNKINVNAYKVG